MKHYPLFRWADFARGLAPKDEADAMRSHLKECTECSREVAFMETLARVSNGMLLARTPDALVRRARAIYPSTAPRTHRLLRIPAELVFDSFLAPAPAGLRATWQVGWQAIYRAGDYSVDVRIEPDLRSCRAALIGQVSNHVTPELVMEDIPVSLKFGARVVAQTRSNRFGEFQMEYDQQSRLQLCIDLEGDGKRIVAPLRRIANPSGDVLPLKRGNRDQMGKSN